MDGGSLLISRDGTTSAAWRRNSDVYYWAEGQPEQKVGSGRDVSMTQSNITTIVAWQEKNRIKVMDLKKRTTSEIGMGISPKLYLLNNGKIICVWEDDKIVRYKLGV